MYLFIYSFSFLVCKSPCWHLQIKEKNTNFDDTSFTVADPNVLTCSCPSGWLHVRPRRCRQHVWEQKDWLLVQSLACGSQPAGTDLGETAENVPSRSPAVHPSAAQPGTDTHTDSAAQVGKGSVMCVVCVSTDSKMVEFCFFSFDIKFLEGLKRLMSDCYDSLECLFNVVLCKFVCF